MGAYLIKCQDDQLNGMSDWWNKVNFLPNNVITRKHYDDWTNWNGTDELNKANAMEALSDSYDYGIQHIIAHEDHSGFNSIGTSQRCQNEKISITDLDNISHNSESIYKIMFSAGCESNQFNKESFSEHFINGSGIDDNHKGIGIAYIGNSGLGFGDAFEQGFNFFKYTYDSPLINLGKIFIEARNGHDGSNDMKNLNFLGDPELPVWTAEPDELSIIHNPGSLTIGENSLEITITGLSDEEEAMVCIYKENEVYGVKTTTRANGTHKATFDCKPDTEDTEEEKFSIVATCPNHLFAKTNIEVDHKNLMFIFI